MPKERNSQILRVLGMIKDLGSTPEGLPVSTLCKKYGVTRRTIERDLLVLEKHGYKVDTQPDDEPGKVRKRIIPDTPIKCEFPVSVTEVAAARAAEKALARDANQTVAATFSTLVDRLEQYQPIGVQVDGAGLGDKIAYIMEPMAQSVAATDIMHYIYKAILDTRVVKVHYRKGGIEPVKEYMAEPYGLLFGSKNYLVWRGCDDRKYRLFAIPYIDKIEVTDQGYIPDGTFSVEKFAETSFGIYIDKPLDVEIVVKPEGRPRLDGFTFHPSQRIKSNPDGSATVRFNASGVDELCWHLFSWGDTIRINAPEELKAAFAHKLEEAKNMLGE